MAPAQVACEQHVSGEAGVPLMEITLYDSFTVTYVNASDPTRTGSHGAENGPPGKYGRHRAL